MGKKCPSPWLHGKGRGRRCEKQPGALRDDNVYTSYPQTAFSVTSISHVYLKLGLDKYWVSMLWQLRYQVLLVGSCGPHFLQALWRIKVQTHSLELSKF